MPKKQLTIDMHCHPSLKTWLFNSKFEINNLTFSKEFFPTDMRVDYPKLVKGNVDIIMSALYLVEHRLFTDCKNIRLLSRIIFYIFKNLKKKSFIAFLLIFFYICPADNNFITPGTKLCMGYLTIRK